MEGSSAAGKGEGVVGREGPRTTAPCFRQPSAGQANAVGGRGHWPQPLISGVGAGAVDGRDTISPLFLPGILVLPREAEAAGCSTRI